MACLFKSVITPPIIFLSLIKLARGYPDPLGRMPPWHHSSSYLIFSPVRCKNSKKTQNPHELGRHTDFPAGVGRFIYRPSSRIPPDTSRALKTGHCLLYISEPTYRASSFLNEIMKKENSLFKKNIFISSLVPCWLAGWWPGLTWDGREAAGQAGTGRVWLHTLRARQETTRGDTTGVIVGISLLCLNISLTSTLRPKPPVKIESPGLPFRTYYPT